MLAIISSIKFKKMLNIVLFGPPGSGKGTQSERIISKYNLLHLSTGDLLRGEIANGTPLGIKAKGYMDKGKLVPDEVVIGMIDNKLKENKEAKGFIFDGFPRTVTQAEALDELLQKNNTTINGMIALQVDEKELTKRLLLRGKTSGRADDQDESLIRKRVQEYENKTAPVAAYYDRKRKYTPINGIGKIEDIFENIYKEIDKQ